MMENIYTILADLHWSMQAALIFVPYLILCFLTRNVDKDTMDKSIAEVAGFFKYRSETDRIERWRVLSEDDPEGDCEDLALTVVDRTGGGFMWNVCNMFKFRLWHVKDPSGRGHLIGVCKHGAFDNHKMKLTPVERYKSEGYRFVFPWPFWLIPIKMLIGRFK